MGSRVAVIAACWEKVASLWELLIYLRVLEVER